MTSYFGDDSSYQAPQLFYWQDPDTGEIVAVDASGNPLPSPPVLREVPAEVLPNFPWINAYTHQWVSGEAHGTIVVDQWGHVVRPLYPPGDFGIGEDGSPTSGYLSDWDPNTYGWPPFEWPPMSMHHPSEWTGSSAPWQPPVLMYWEDPATGQLVAIGEDGTPLAAPPALHKLPDGSVVDQWGNPVSSLWPPGDLGIDPATGAPTGGTTMPPGFQPPEMYYWTDPATGQVVAVGQDGTPLTSPPQLTMLSSEQRQAMGFPPGETEIVVDQWGNVVIPLHPPGGFGYNEETGQWQEESPGEWPPDSWPPETEGDTEAGGEAAVEEPDEEPDQASGETAADAAAGATSEGESVGGRGGFTEGEDASRHYTAVEMQEGPVRRDDDLNEPPERAAAEIIEASVTGLEGAELGEAVLSQPSTDALAAAESPGAPGEPAGAIPITIPMPRPPEPAETAERVEAEPPGVPGETIGVIPINLPTPPPPEAGEVVRATDQPPGSPGDSVGAIPITIPMPRPPEPAETAERVEAELPGVPRETISAIPINLSTPPPPEAGETVEATPIPLPSPPSPEAGDSEMVQLIAEPIGLPEEDEAQSRLADLTPLTADDANLRSETLDDVPGEEEPPG